MQIGLHLAKVSLPLPFSTPLPIPPVPPRGLGKLTLRTSSTTIDPLPQPNRRPDAKPPHWGLRIFQATFRRSFAGGRPWQKSTSTSNGLNLNYGALRDTPYRWLKLGKLSQGLPKAGDHVQRIRCFTALINHPTDPTIRQRPGGSGFAQPRTSPKRQQFGPAPRQPLTPAVIWRTHGHRTQPNNRSGRWSPCARGLRIFNTAKGGRH